jgi:hypothetical protein
VRELSPSGSRVLFLDGSVIDAETGRGIRVDAGTVPISFADDARLFVHRDGGIELFDLETRAYSPVR